MSFKGWLYMIVAYSVAAVITFGLFVGGSLLLPPHRVNWPAASWDTMICIVGEVLAGYVAYLVRINSSPRAEQTASPQDD